MKLISRYLLYICVSILLFTCSDKATSSNEDGTGGSNFKTNFTIELPFAYNSLAQQNISVSDQYILLSDEVSNTIYLYDHVAKSDATLFSNGNNHYRTHIDNSGFAFSSNPFANAGAVLRAGEVFVYQKNVNTGNFIKTDTLTNGVGNDAKLGNTITSSETEYFINDEATPFFSKVPGIHVFDKTENGVEKQFIEKVNGELIRYRDGFLFSLYKSIFKILTNDGTEWAVSQQIDTIPTLADGFQFVFFADFALSGNTLALLAFIEGPGTTGSNTRRAALLLYKLENNIFTFDKMFQLNHFAKSVAISGTMVALGNDRFDANLGMTDELSGMSHGSVEVYKISGSNLEHQYRLSPGTEGKSFGAIIKLIGNQLFVFELDKIHAFDFPGN
jgi:hypothetical protein